MFAFFSERFDTLLNPMNSEKKVRKTKIAGIYTQLIVTPVTYHYDIGYIQQNFFN